MNKANGYNGTYKGYEDEYGVITMSPWIEDLMDELSKLPNAASAREELINASYMQKEDPKSIESCLIGLMIGCNDHDIYECYKKAMAKEREFLSKNLN